MSIIATLTAIVAAVLFSSTANAATADQLAACKTATDPTDCFLTLKQACPADDADCIRDIDLAWALQRAEAAEAKVQTAKPRVETRDGLPTITNAFPVGGLPAPEFADPPLQAFSAEPAGWVTCSHCAQVHLNQGRTYMILGNEGPVPVIDRYSRVRTVVGNFDGDGRITSVEVAGTPVTWPDQEYIYLVGRPGVRTEFKVQEVMENRPGYWLLGPNRTGLFIAGSRSSPQRLTIPPVY